MTDWTEVSLRVRPEASEAVAELLQDYTGSGVTIEPAIEALGPDEGYVLDESAPLTLHAYIYGDVEAERRAELERLLSEEGLLVQVDGVRWGTIREEDWAEAWKTHYDIEKVGRVVVRPAWREYTAQPGEIVISLDPGMAFGTGQHPTTRMCLQGGQELLRPGDRVLDLGSGSGILALAALALGAGEVVATDTEEQAVESSIANVALNRMQDRIEVLPGSVEAVAALPPFDLVFANINAATIVRLARDLASLLKLGAVVLAGGVIEPREAEVRAALEAAELRIERVLQDGDWRTFQARRERLETPGARDR